MFLNNCGSMSEWLITALILESKGPRVRFPARHCQSLQTITFTRVSQKDAMTLIDISSLKLKMINIHTTINKKKTKKTGICNLLLAKIQHLCDDVHLSKWDIRTPLASKETS